MAEPGAEETAVEKGSSKKKWMILALLGVVVLALAGGGAAYFMMSGSSEEVAAEPSEDAEEGQDEAVADTAGDDGKPKEEKSAENDPKAADSANPEADKKEANKTASTGVVDFGETFPLKTFHLNLGNPLENHFIRLEVALEYRGGETQKAELERRLPQVRDAVVAVVSKKSREFLLGPDGKAQLRREILIRINRYMTQPVESVYLTDMLIE